MVNLPLVVMETKRTLASCLGPGFWIDCLQGGIFSLLLCNHLYLSVFYYMKMKYIQCYHGSWVIPLPTPQPTSDVTLCF